MLDPLAEYQKARETIEQAICRVMIAMMLSDGEISDSEKDVVYQLFTHLAGEELSDEQFDKERASVEDPAFKLHEYLQSIAEELNDDGKEKVMRGAFMVAAADGVFHEKEQSSLETMGQSLGIAQEPLSRLLDIMKSENPSQAIEEEQEKLEDPDS